MAFPPPTIQTNITDATDQAGLHPELHNKLAAGVNDITTEVIRVNGDLTGVTNRVGAVEGRVTTVEGRVTTVENTVTGLSNDAKRLGTVRGRTNIDTITTGGSVRYTLDYLTDGVVDLGDGSGYTVPPGVYGVTASTVSGDAVDMTCYVMIGSRPVAVGTRLPGDGASYVTWVGVVGAGEHIAIRVYMPTQTDVIDGRLEIWRIAESTP